MSNMSEQSIAAARASVMVYDDANKKWVPSGSSSGLSKVHIYQHLTNNTFRVVGRKLQDHEVVINCAILKGLKYNQATPTFHQWRDNKQVYGLNFSSRDDADAFALAMIRTLDMINQNSSRPSPHSIGSQPLYQTIPGDMESNNIDQSKWVENDARIPHQVQYVSSSGLAPPSNGPQVTNSGSPSSTIHRSMAAPTYAPPAPPAPPVAPVAAPPPPPPPPPPPSSGPTMPPCPPPPPGPIQSGPPPPPPPMNSYSGPPAPPCPPSMNSYSGPPGPPCPPPPPGSLQRPGGAPSPMSLASALANAKLKKTPRASENTNDGNNKPNSGGSAHSNMASMMDEMAKTLARRRAQAEGLQNSNDVDGEKKGWEKQSSSNGNNGAMNSSGAESPKGNRRQRIGSISDVDSLRTNGPELFDIDRLKQEILLEIRMEITKMKQDIIDVIRMECSRR